MGQLVVRFHNLVLFVNRPDGLRVLLPKRDHFAVLTGLGDSIALSGHVIELRRDGDLIRERTLRPAGEYLIHLDALTPEPCPIKCGPELNDLLLARIELGGGQLVETPLQQGDQAHKECEWLFDGCPSHKLTDYAEFRIELAEPSTYSMLVISGSLAQVFPLGGGAVLDVIVGEDHSEGPVGAQLSEMQYVYDLLAGNPNLPLPADPSFKARARASAVLKSFVGPDNRDLRCAFPLCPNAQIEG